MGMLLEKALTAPTEPLVPDTKPALAIALPTNPDDNAKNNAIARDIGVPVEAVEADPPAFKEAHKQRLIDKALATSPSTSTFIANPENAKVAHDSVGQLAEAEAAVNGRKGSGILRAYDDVKDFTGLSSLEAGAVNTIGTSLHGIGELYGVAERQIGARVSRGAQSALKAIGMTDLADAIATPAPWWADPSQILMKPGEAIKDIAEETRPAKENRNLYTDTVEGVGQVTAQIALALATGGVSTGLNLALLAGQGADQQSDQIKQSGAEQGDATDAALVSGAAITMLTEKFGLGNLLDKIPATIKSRIGRILAGGASEMSQEVVEGVLQNLTALAMYDPTQEIFEGVERAGTVGGFVGMIAAAVIPGKQAIQTRDNIDEATKAIMSSPLFGRDPVTAAQAYAGMLKDKGYKEVYIPATELAKVIDASEDPVALSAALGVTDTMAEALALGGDVRIGADAYTQHIALTDNLEGLKDHIRYGDNAMSAAEAEEFAKTGVKDEAARQAAAVSRDAEDAPSAASEVPSSAFNGDTATAIENVFLSEEGADAVPLSNFGFTPEEATALEKAGLASDGKMSREQWSRYDEERSARLSPKKAKANNGDSVSQEPAEPDPVTLAEEQLGLQGLLTPDDMSKAQHEAYMLAVARSKDGARKRQARKILRQQERENDAAYKAEREKIESEVRQEVEQIPVYSALNAIGRERLDRAALVDALPPYMTYNQETGENKMRSSQEQLADLPKVKGRQIYASAREGGINPEILAEQSGFQSVQEMIEAMIISPTFDEAVAAQTDLVMKQRHGDLMERGQAIKAAIESLHNDDQAALLAFELNQLRDAKKEGRMTPALLRAEARKNLARHLVREVRADNFLKNERKAGTEAGVLLRKGDRTGAAKAKFRQLLNFQYVREAYAIRAAFTKQAKELRKFTRPRKEWRQIDANFMDKIKALLAGYDFTKAQKPDGSDMTWGEWQELYEQAKYLEAQGRAARKYTLRNRRVERDWLVAEMTEKANELPDTKRSKQLVKRQDKSALGKFTGFVSGWFSESKKIELELQKLDGGELGGIWHQAIFQKVADAQTAREDLRRDVVLKLMKKLENLPKETKAKFRQRIQTNLREHPMRRSELIMLALNMGNASNMEKVIEGSKKEGLEWTEADLIDAVSHLTDTEWKWVQEVWNTFDALYPKVEAIFRDERGTSPAKVEPREFETATGLKLKGGYFPMMYDQERRPPMAGKSALEMMEDEARGSVYSGMTKSRTGYSAPVSLDISQLARGMEQAIHYTTHYETVRDLRALLKTKEVYEAVRSKAGADTFNEFELWLEAIATNNRDMESTRAWTAIFQYFRSAMSTAVMGASYTTMASQTFGLATSVDELGRKPNGGFSSAQGSKWMGIGLAAFHKDWAGSTRMVRELSGEMRHRLENTNREIAQGVRSLREPTGIPGLDQYRDIQRASLMMIGGMQFYSVDMPTWLGAFAKAQSEGKEQGDAVAYADAVVRLTQSSGYLKDLVHIQRKTGLWRAATMFATYTILLYNRTVDAGSGAKRIKNVPAAVARLGWLLVIPAMADALLRGEGPDEDDEDPEAFYALKLLTYTMSAIPVIGRGISSGIEGYTPSMLAIDGMGNNFLRGTKAVGKLMFSEDEMEDKDYRAIATAVGYMAGVPGTAQLNRVLSAIEAEDDASLYDYLVGHKEKR